MSTANQIARRVTTLSIFVSVGLAAPMFAAYWIFGSKLALAQAADSFTDSFTALALLYSIRIAALPADEGHPHGHHRAEPIAALVAAVLAGVVSFEVFREAASALLGHSEAIMSWSLAIIFSCKFFAKWIIRSISLRAQQSNYSPALNALAIDARNDMLVAVLALAGFFATRFGWPGWDAWLAIPIAAWIAAAGISLALENISLLMGEAAPEQRHDELQTIALATPGVLGVHQIIARHDGTHLDVNLHIVVDEKISVRHAHDIAELVESRLLDETDVMHVAAHVDVDDVDDVHETNHEKPAANPALN
jgi:ferrous-iron efflux pump FieF